MLKDEQNYSYNGGGDEFSTLQYIKGSDNTNLDKTIKISYMYIYVESHNSIVYGLISLIHL